MSAVVATRFVHATCCKHAARLSYHLIMCHCAGCGRVQIFVFFPDAAKVGVKDIKVSRIWAWGGMCVGDHTHTHVGLAGGCQLVPSNLVSCVLVMPLLSYHKHLCVVLLACRASLTPCRRNRSSELSWCCSQFSHPLQSE